MLFNTRSLNYVLGLLVLNDKKTNNLSTHLLFIVINYINLRNPLTTIVMCSDQDFGVMTDSRIKDDLEDCVAANWNVGEAIKDIDVNGAGPISQEV